MNSTIIKVWFPFWPTFAQPPSFAAKELCGSKRTRVECSAIAEVNRVTVQTLPHFTERQIFIRGDIVKLNNHFIPAGVCMKKFPLKNSLPGIGSKFVWIAQITKSFEPRMGQLNKPENPENIHSQMSRRFLLILGDSLAHCRRTRMVLFRTNTAGDRYCYRSRFVLDREECIKPLKPFYISRKCCETNFRFK